MDTMPTSSQPVRTQTATPTLNHLLRMPPPPGMPGQGLPPPFPSSDGGLQIPPDSQGPHPISFQQFNPNHNQPPFQAYKPMVNYPDPAGRPPEFQQRTLPGMPPNFPSPGGLPPGQRQQQTPAHIPHSPLQKPTSSPASVKEGVEEGRESLANGSASVGQSPKSVGEPTTHPSVAALRQEGGAPSRSPSRTSAGAGSPSAPPRHSPVSPAPVSGYGSSQSVSVSGSVGGQPPFTTISAGFNGHNPLQPYGNYGYPAGFVPPSSEQSGAGGGGTPLQFQPSYGASPAPGGDPQQPYFGAYPRGPGYPPTAFPGNYGPSSHPQMPYGSPRTPLSSLVRIPPGPGALPPHQPPPVTSNGHPQDNLTPTPTKKPKNNQGPNDGASLPSTPGTGTQSPGNQTGGDMEASPSWPHTPLSPAVSGGHRTPMPMPLPAPLPPPPPSHFQPPPSSTGPPPPTPAPTTTSTPSKSSGKDMGSIVERLTGPFANFHPEEYTQRRAFFEALVQFCESRTHPITTQPTVSKQPVDLFKLYHAVKERGGFETVTKAKGWKSLCPLANLNADSSSAGYQLRKHYIRYLLPCECAWDGGGRDPQELIDMVERQKKPKKKKQPKQADTTVHFLSHSSPYPDPPPQDAQQVQPGDPGAPTGFPPPGTQFPYAQQPDGTGHHPPQGGVPPWQTHPSMVNGPYSGQPGGGPQYPQMPPQQPPQQAYTTQPRIPVPASVQGGGGYAPSPGVPPPHSGGGEMVARDPFDDRSGTPQFQQTAPRPPAPPAQSPYQVRPYPGGPQPQQPQPQQGGPGGSVSHYQPPSAGPPQSVVSSAAQPAYQLVTSAAGAGDPSRAHTPAAINQQAPQPSSQQPRQPLSLPSYAPPPPTSVYSGQMPGQQAGMTPHMGYYRTPHPGYYQSTPVSVAGSQPLPPSSQYPPGGGSSEGGNQSATPPYVHPQALSAPVTVVSTAPSSVPFGAPPGNQYAPPGTQWQQRYPPPPAQQTQPHVLPPSSSAVFNGPRVPGMMRDKSGYYQPGPSGYQPQPSSVYPPGAIQGRPGDSKSLVHPLGAVAGRRDPPPAVFPPGSVEATQPTFRKRRKKFARDIGKVEAWRLMMALKSGLMSESHWALNVLNILLYDDSSAMYFGLRSLPGLLEVLVEHLRRSLMEIFPEENFKILEEYCSPCTAPPAPSVSEEDSPHWKLTEAPKHGINCIPKEKMEGERMNGKIFSSLKDFTRMTRTGRPVQVRTAKGGERRRLGSAEQESERNCIMNSSHWKEGGGLSTEHLRLKRFQSVEESECLQFAKRLRLWEEDSEGKKEEEKKSPEEDSADASKPVSPARVKLFYRTGTKEDENAVGCDIKTDRASALTDKSDYRKSLIGKCLAVSNILRGLVVIPGNEAEMAKHAGLLLILGRLMLIHHKHLPSSCKFRRFADEERPKTTASAVAAETLWEKDAWIGECAATLREDAFVMICQLSAQLDLWNQEEAVSGGILSSLIHWVICGSAEAGDPLPPGVLSPLRYSLEALCKLSVLEKNVDLILATPPWPRTERMLEVLGGLLNLGEEIPCREFALVLVNAMCAGSEVACASTALGTPAVHYLVSFLEQADANMHQVVQAHGMQALRENPELMGTSVGMLRRAATVLQCLSRVPACRPRFIRHQQRLLQFTMSQLMDSRVAAIIADTLFELQKPTGELFFIEAEELSEEKEEEGDRKEGES